MDEQTASGHEFASWQSYYRFAMAVRGRRRFVWDDETRAFLDAVRGTLQSRRDIGIPSGEILYRAQRGIDYQPRLDEEGNVLGEEPWGYDAPRMKPLKNRANEGRANSAGIPVLYLASTEQTAISEVRPWIGAEVSVARFRVSRPLRAVDLTLGHGQSSFLSVVDLFGAEPGPEGRARAVWIDIDNAFSTPVTLSDGETDYVPTQILTELFRDAGFDAIIYRSQFGPEGRNYVLFNIDDAEVVSCAPYRVNSLEIGSAQMGNGWYHENHSADPVDGGDQDNKRAGAC